MRILQVNKFYYPRGGADKYFLDLSSALESAGDQVAVFSMASPNNLPSKFSPYFVSNIDFDKISPKDFLKIPGRIIYSLEAKRKFKKLVADFKPDIIHIHNIYHQISPSILDVARSAKIPVVMHLHDYKLICPNYQLFVDGKTCEACRKTKYYHCTQKKCLKGSTSKSLLATIEMYIHHSILKIYKKNITFFISPSQFMKNEIISFGWPENKIEIIANPYSSSLIATEEEISNNNEENYLLYFGRLSPEKGLTTLIKAAAISNLPIKFVGAGPEEENLRKEAKRLNVLTDFTGFKHKEELKLIILKAKAVIIPSIWYENMPLSLLEALSLGKIVIASDIGGIPEIISPGINGLLFKPGDAKDLSDKINSLDNIIKSDLKKAARESVKNFTLKNNAEKVKQLYTRILKNTP